MVGLIRQLFDSQTLCMHGAAMDSSQDLPRRRLGRNGPVVSSIGLGCMGMSSFYGTPDDTQSRATLRRALDLGVTLFDTSSIYGNGHNEELIGRVLAPFR